MEPQNIHPRHTHDVSRRELLKAGLAAGAALSPGPSMVCLHSGAKKRDRPSAAASCACAGGTPCTSIPIYSINVRTHTTLSFVYSRLVRHKVGADVQPGTFIVEPDLAERWEELDDTTYVFHLRKGVKWHNKPPVNGRELVAEDVKFTYDRFLTEKGNADRYILESVDRVEVVDRYTVKFLLKEPYVWLIDVLANPRSMWIIAPEVVQKYRRSEESRDRHRHRPFHPGALRAERQDGLQAQPGLFLQDLPYVDGVEWLVLEDDSTGLAMYRTGQSTAARGLSGTFAKQDLDSLKQSHPHLRYQDLLSN